MNNREKLIDYLKNKNEEVISQIKNDFKDDEIQFAIDYIEELNKTTTHNITKIGHSEQGDFYINCETGITYIK